MEWLLVDQPPIAWSIVGLTVSGMALVAGLAARGQATRREGSILEMFWRDVATIELVLAGVGAAPSLAGMVPIEGFGRPIWVVVAAAAVLVTAAQLVVRWRSQELGRVARQRRVTPTGAPSRRLISTSWEVGVMGAGLTGLAMYIVSADHGFGHPIHWLIAALGLLIGHAIGIGAVTPRVAFEKPTARRS